MNVNIVTTQESARRNVMKNKTYKMLVFCDNWGSNITIKIPKGVKSYGYKVICPKCELPSVIGKFAGVGK